jgi:Zn-dependent peptidase ImmA (M78 family)
MSKDWTPELVLKECGVSGRPVDLDRIIKHFGILRVDLPANDDVFGAIIRQQGHTLIAVNPNQHPNRQRFTIAHELGHYFRHGYDRGKDVEHVDGDFRFHWRNDASSKGIDWNEIESNQFAASLLMPEEFLKADVNKCFAIDRDTIQHLAGLYKVSRLAMQYRLINLGILSPDFDPSAQQ